MSLSLSSRENPNRRKLSQTEMATAVIDYEFLAASTAAGEPSSIYCGPPAPVSKLRYVLPLIKYRKTIFRLNQSIEIALYTDQDGLWICEYEPLSSLVHGDMPGDAVLAFCEEFAVLWDEIAKPPDDNLAPDAQQLKRVLRSLVRAVEQER
jgi:hypothetical protein